MSKNANKLSEMDLLLLLSESIEEVDNLLDKYQAKGGLSKPQLYRVLKRVYSNGRTLEKRAGRNSDLFDMLDLTSASVASDWYYLLVRKCRPDDKQGKLASRWARACRYGASKGWSPMKFELQLFREGGTEGLARKAAKSNRTMKQVPSRSAQRSKRASPLVLRPSKHARPSANRPRAATMAMPGTGRVSNANST